MTECTPGFLNGVMQAPTANERVLVAEIERLDRIRASASAVVQFYANSSKDAYEADAGLLARTEFSRIFEQH